MPPWTLDDHRRFAREVQWTEHALKELLAQYVGAKMTVPRPHVGDDWDTLTYFDALRMSHASAANARHFKRLFCLGGSRPFALSTQGGRRRTPLGDYPINVKCFMHDICVASRVAPTMRHSVYWGEATGVQSGVALSTGPTLSYDDRRLLRDVLARIRDVMDTCIAAFREWHGHVHYLQGEAKLQQLVIVRNRIARHSRFGWGELRALWRARCVAVYWHGLTAALMAPGGRAAKRDRAAFEAEGFAA